MVCAKDCKAKTLGASQGRGGVGWVAGGFDRPLLYILCHVVESPHGKLIVMICMIFVTFYGRDPVELSKPQALLWLPWSIMNAAYEKDIPLQAAEC